MKTRPIEKIIAEYTLGPFEVHGSKDGPYVVNGQGEGMNLGQLTVLANEHNALVEEVARLRGELSQERRAAAKTQEQQASEINANIRRAMEAERQVNLLKGKLMGTERQVWRILERAKKLEYAFLIKDGDNTYFSYGYPDPCVYKGVGAVLRVDDPFCFDLVMEAVLRENSFEALFDDECPIGQGRVGPIKEQPHTAEDNQLETPQ